MVDLFRRRYAVPAIACLYVEAGAKFVTLVNHLGASRDAVTMTLRHLIEKGIVVRNTGYGHPMRPEYLLTRAGERLAEPSLGLVQVVEANELGGLAFRKWPMPVVLAIGQGADRFSVMRQSLDGLTPRALTGVLRELDRREVIEREVKESWPPYPSYALAPVGEALLPSLDRLGMVAAALQ